MSKPLFPYQQVRQFALDQIASGQWRPGGLIPSEMKLAEQLSVHRLTVNRVLTELAREGLVERRRGVGTTLLAQRKRSIKPGSGHGLVGLITGHPFDPVGNPFYGVIFEKLRRILKAHSIYLIPLGDASEFFDSQSSLAVPPEDLSALAMLGNPDNPRTMRLLEESSHPAVIIAVSEYEGPLPHVATEDAVDAGLVAKKLLALGHRRIVHLNAIPPMRIQSRLNGFLAACEQEGHSLPFRYLAEAGGLEIRDGKEAMQEFLKLGLPFTAVFGAIDNLALGAMAALLESGVKIPQQVSLVGFDGIDAAVHGVPPLSTMRVSRSSLAEQAAECLVAICNGKPAPKQRRQIRSRWIEGSTLGAAPADPFSSQAG